MSSRTALWLCGTALGLGIIGDQLLRAGPWGLGAALWIGLCVGAALVALRITRQADFAALATPLLTAAFFAGCLAWRDAEALKIWNVFAALVALTLGLVQLRRVRLWATGLGAYVIETATAVLRAAVAPLLLLGRDLVDPAADDRRVSRRLRAVAVGLVVTIPIVALFGALLASADPVFDRLTRVFWDLDWLLSHLMVIALLSWLAAGYLRSAVARPAEREAAGLSVPNPGWGAIEIGVPLGALVVLFGVFVVVQGRYLFGGDDLIRTTVGLTYAEYARRGFFELVAVAGLVLPVLLVADLTLRQDDRQATRVFRGLGAAVLALVGCIIGSAAYRLWLYYGAYGWTEDRFYAAAVMTWIAAALAWLGMTVLRGRGGRFVLGAAVAGFAVVAAMNVLDPDATIARTNLARAERGAELDVDYLRRLSADAAGVLAAAVPALASTERCTVLRALAADHERRDGDWRSWSLGRARADRAFRTVAAGAAECPADADAPSDLAEQSPG